MILDIQSTLGINQAVTVTAPSQFVYDTAGLGVGVPVTNIFGLATASGSPPSFGEDMGGAGPAIGAPQLGVWVPTAFTAGGAGTLQVQLQCAVDTNNTGTPGTWETIAESAVFALADINSANTSLRALVSYTVPERYPGQGLPRFYRTNYVVGTGPMTAGALTAALLTGVDSIQITPANY